MTLTPEQFVANINYINEGIGAPGVLGHFSKMLCDAVPSRLSAEAELRKLDDGGLIIRQHLFLDDVELPHVQARIIVDKNDSLNLVGLIQAQEERDKWAGNKIAPDTIRFCMQAFKQAGASFVATSNMENMRPLSFFVENDFRFLSLKVEDFTKMLEQGANIESICQQYRFSARGLKVLHAAVMAYIDFTDEKSYRPVFKALQISEAASCL